MSLINSCVNTTSNDYDCYLSKTNICSEYSKFIQTIPWQWFATLTFSPKINNPEMVKDHKLISPVPHPVFWTQVFLKPPGRLRLGRATEPWPARG